jgi:hypothetical protein
VAAILNLGFIPEGQVRGTLSLVEIAVIGVGEKIYEGIPDCMLICFVAARLTRRIATYAARTGAGDRFMRLAIEVPSRNSISTAQIPPYNSGSRTSDFTNQ